MCFFFVQAIGDKIWKQHNFPAMMHRAQALLCSVAMFGSLGLPHVPGQTDSGSTPLRHVRKRPRAWQGLPSQGLPNCTPKDFGSRWGPLVVAARLPGIDRLGVGPQSIGISSEGIAFGLAAESPDFDRPRNYHSSQEGGATGSSPSVWSQLPNVGDSVAASSASSAGGSGDSMAAPE